LPGFYREAVNTDAFPHLTPEAARTKGLQLLILNATTQSEIDTAFASLDLLHAAALVVAPDPFFGTRWKQFVTLASHHHIPTIYAWREFVSGGGLISYGTSLPAAYRQVGIYAGKIRAGADSRRRRGDTHIPSRQRVARLS